MPWFFWNRVTQARMTIGAAIAVIIVLSCGTFSSPAAAASPGLLTNVVTVPLEYREMPYRSFLYDVLFREVPVEFQSRSPGPVFRGVMKFGGGASNAVAFLWQPGPRKLVLDLNRNLDLTDDAAGVFTGTITGPRIPGVSQQVFTNIHLTFPATSAGAPMLVDFNMFQYGEGKAPLVNAMARSYWRGKVAVGGREWELGLLQNLSREPGSFAHGELLLRPWQERDSGFVGWAAGEDAWGLPFEYKNRALKAADAFELSQRVFFEGHAWSLAWDAEPATNNAAFAVRLVEERPVLGKLRITGRYVERVVMTGGPYAVVLARPGASVRVPVGSYYQPVVWLKQGKEEAYFNSLPKSGEATVREPRLGSVMPLSGVAEAGKVVVVGEHTPAVLAMGGPLTNALVASRHGRELKLRHHLVGAGGEEYKLWEYWRRQGDVPPEFVIYKGNKQMASDKFKFG